MSVGISSHFLRMLQERVRRRGIQEEEEHLKLLKTKERGFSVLMQINTNSLQKKTIISE